MKFGRNDHLARNLANAYAAAQLGTTVATQERNNRDGKVGEFWYIVADDLMQAFLEQQDAKERAASASVQAIQ